jgi:hypothetical protein
MLKSSSSLGFSFGLVLSAYGLTFVAKDIVDILVAGGGSPNEPV